MIVIWWPLYQVCRAISWLGDRLFGASNVVCSFVLWLANVTYLCGVFAWAFPHEVRTQQVVDIFISLFLGVQLRKASAIRQMPVVMGPGSPILQWMRIFYGFLFILTIGFDLAVVSLGAFGLDDVMPDLIWPAFGLLLMHDEHDGEKSLVRKAQRLIDRALSPSPQAALERS